MAYNIPSLTLDTTGTNVNNRIIDEPHTLSNRNIRSIGPNYGPFFAESVVVRDGINILQRGIDYQIVELHQELTLRFGKEISSVILIINRSVNTNLTITYQAVGGHFAFSSSAIANMYQTVLQDNRPVNWTNITNRPSEFNPVIHRHLLDDIYGFEPVVDSLERIKRAITLGQVEIVLSIIDELVSDFTCKELNRTFPVNKLIKHDALLAVLSKHRVLSPITINLNTCENTKGRMLLFSIDTTQYPVGRTLYWEFFKPSGVINLFSTFTGSFVTNGGIIQRGVYLTTDERVEEYPLYLGVKENTTDTEYIALTYKVIILDAATTPENRFPYLYFENSGLHDFNYSRTYTDTTVGSVIFLMQRLRD